jgi:hypothetical protein
MKVLQRLIQYGVIENNLTRRFPKACPFGGSLLPKAFLWKGQADGMSWVQFTLRVVGLRLLSLF